MPKVDIFTGGEFPGVNKKLKTDFIPDDIVEQIEQALKKETNSYLKSGIIILKSTGMRVSELLLLKTHYLQKHPVHGWELTWLDSKKRSLRQPTPINVECLQAFRHLEKYTLPLREEADGDIKEFLFLHKPAQGPSGKKVRIPTSLIFNCWFKKFIKTHHIVDSTGELFHLTSHQFRRTLATDMISNGVEINAVRDLLGHQNSSTTWRHYADVKDKERAEMFHTVGIIGNINMIDESLIPDQEERQWFQENHDKGARLSDGYCTKPFETEDICPTFLKRQKCFGCNRFVTTPEYLDKLESYLADLERDLEDNSMYGEHYANHLTPTMDALREIIYRLEELKGGYSEAAPTITQS